MRLANWNHRHPYLILIVEVPSPAPPLLVWLILLSMLLRTGYIWNIANNEVKRAAHVTFQRNVKNVYKAVHLRMHAYDQVLRSGIALFNASTQVTRQDWQVFTNTLSIEKNYPGIQGLGYAQYVRMMWRG